MVYFPDKPIWKARQRSKFYGFISGTSNLTCEAEAEPPASFAWFDQRGKPIREGAILTENQISTLVVSIFFTISDGVSLKNFSSFSYLLHMMTYLANIHVKLPTKWVRLPVKSNCQKEPNLVFQA